MSTSCLKSGRCCGARRLKHFEIYLPQPYHRKKFRVPDIGKYPRNRLIPPHIPNIGFVEQKQPWVFAAEFYDSMLVKRVSTGGN